jgi:hypothetical protein
MIGRPLKSGKRELVIGSGSRGYAALYRFVSALDTVFVLAIRGRRERGYKHPRCRGHQNAVQISGVNLGEIAAVPGFTESRVCQRHRQPSVCERSRFSIQPRRPAREVGPGLRGRGGEVHTRHLRVPWSAHP